MATCGNCSTLPNAVAIVLEHARRRVVERLRLLRVQGVVRERRLERLVVLGEGPFGHVPAREEARHALRIHDERAHAAGGILVDLEVRHVGAAPGRAVPGDQLARRDCRACRSDRRRRGCRARGGWRAKPTPS